MKEDILEQLVDEYLMHKGYFTIHNVKFRPDKTHPDFSSKTDAVSSDIDVIGYHPMMDGPSKVVVVSCKAWQEGFDPRSRAEAIHENKKVSGRESWKGFRELVKPKWSSGFLEAVYQKTGCRDFEYWTAVTWLKRPELRTEWEEDPTFKRALAGNRIRLITFGDMLEEVWRDLKRSPAASELGRVVQLIKASRWRPPA